VTETVLDESFYEAVASLLRRAGVNAAWQDTGGGTMCIIIADADGASDDPRLVFGTAGEVWAAEVFEDGSSTTQGVQTTVASSTSDPTAVCAGILHALADVVQS
jgi:hypothetical protein